MGGRCRIFPLKPWKTPVRVPSSPSQAFREVTSPVTSSVVVSSPSLRTPSYPFGSSLRNGTSFVASLITTGRTPVAKGSSVPMCPAFFTRRRRFTSLTTPREVGPSGLSTIRRPSILTLFPAFLGLFPLFNLAKDLAHVDPVFNGRIEVEQNLRRVPQRDS